MTRITPISTTLTIRVVRRPSRCENIPNTSADPPQLIACTENRCATAGMSVDRSAAIAGMNGAVADPEAVTTNVAAHIAISIHMMLRSVIVSTLDPLLATHSYGSRSIFRFARTQPPNQAFVHQIRQSQRPVRFAVRRRWSQEIFECLQQSAWLEDQIERHPAHDVAVAIGAQQRTGRGVRRQIEPNLERFRAHLLPRVLHRQPGTCWNHHEQRLGEPSLTDQILQLGLQARAKAGHEDHDGALLKRWVG